MITLLFILVVVCLAIWAAQSAPPPFSFILWAVVALVVVWCLLDVTGMVEGHHLGRLH